MDLSRVSLPEFVEKPNPEIYFSDNYLVIDFETYGGSYGDAGDAESGIVLAAWLDGKGLVAPPESPEFRDRVEDRIEHEVAGEFGFSALRSRINSADFIVAHNSKFEIKWLCRMGLDPRRILAFCTQIGEYVILGNRRAPLGLDATARRYGIGGKHHFAGRCIKAGIDTRDIPERALIDYCRNDVRITHELFLKQREILKRDGLLPVALARNLVTPTLASIEFEGMQLDPDRVRERMLGVQREYGEATSHLDRITGGINFRSPKQLAGFIYDDLGFHEHTDRRGQVLRTDSGKPKTDKDTLGSLKPTNQRQRDFLAAIKAVTPLKKKIQILNQLDKCCKDDNGRLYANFNQTITQTHRLSSTGGKYKLQFQNFPRAFKPLFRPRDDGWVLCEADATQLEFRVAVDLGSDERGKRDVREGVDVHQLTATVMGVSRQNAKAHTFKPLYGGQSGTPRQRAYYSAFRERYPNIYRTQSGWTYSVLASKRLRIPSGLIFYFPDAELRRSGYINRTPDIFNYPIQSFATADIIPLTLVLVWHQIAHLRVRLVSTVHDSIIAEVHPDDLAEYKQILVDCFTNLIYDLLLKLYNYNFTTPLGVGIKTGTHWGEGEEEKHERHS